jgi:transposase-like protein
MQCPYCRSKRTKLSGIRSVRKGPVQRIKCMDCSKYFSSDPSPGTRYPLKLILHSISLYDAGHPAPFIIKEIAKRYHRTVPETTFYTWTKRYRDDLTFLKLRNRYDLDPSTLISTRELHHQQVFPFRYHTLKLNIASKLHPGIKRYIGWVISSLPDRMFMEGPRASTFKMDKDLVAVETKDDVTSLCKLALERSSHPDSAHTSVEDFFLTNDDITVCTELPVFLNPSELPGIGLRKPLTGHIDIVQVRTDGVWVLDYKPNLNDPNKYSSQMFLYREALHRRTSVPRERIHIMAFNERSSFIFDQNGPSTIPPTSWRTI